MDLNPAAENRPRGDARQRAGPGDRPTSPGTPDPKLPEQRVAFGTSGHRGSSLKQAFNEEHILAITQAICRTAKSTGSMGRSSWASIRTRFPRRPWPGAGSAGRQRRAGDARAERRVHPHPAVSLAIRTYNRDRKTGLADGIVGDALAQPAADGGFNTIRPTAGRPTAASPPGWKALASLNIGR